MHLERRCDLCSQQHCRRSKARLKEADFMRCPAIVRWDVEGASLRRIWAWLAELRWCDEDDPRRGLSEFHLHTGRMDMSGPQVVQGSSVEFGTTIHRAGLSRSVKITRSCFPPSCPRAKSPDRHLPCSIGTGVYRGRLQMLAGQLSSCTVGF
jgi:hypothetical protein